MIEDELTDEDTRRDWVAGSTSIGSVNAFLRRLRSSVRPLAAIVRGDLGHRGDHSVTTSKAQVTVVDLHNLPDRAQRFVVGCRAAAGVPQQGTPGHARPLISSCWTS